MLKYSYGILYVIITALSVLFVHYVDQNLPPAVTLLVSTFLTVIFFHAINFRHIVRLYTTLLNFKRSWFTIMGIITLVWIFSIYGPGYVAPDIFILCFFAMSFVFGSLFKLLNPAQRSLRVLTGLVIVVLSSSTIVWHYLQWINLSRDILIGILMGLCCGAFTFWYGKQTYHLAHNAQFSTTQILAVRFWLIIPIAIVLSPPHSLTFLSLHTFPAYMGVALLSMIIPTFLFQKSVMAIGPEQSSILLGFVPALTYVLSCWYYPGYFTASGLILYLLTALGIGLVSFKKKAQP